MYVYTCIRINFVNGSGTNIYFCICNMEMLHNRIFLAQIRSLTKVRSCRNHTNQNTREIIQKVHRSKYRRSFDTRVHEFI